MKYRLLNSQIGASGDGWDLGVWISTWVWWFPWRCKVLYDLICMWLRVRNGSWLVQSLGAGFDLNLFFSTQLKHFIKQKPKIYIKATDTNFSKSWFDSPILIGFQFIALAGMIHPRTILHSDLYCIQWD